MIEQAHNQSEQHMNDTQYNRDFHLERIMENDLVLRQLPYRIHTDRIRRTAITLRRPRIQIEFPLSTDVI